MFTDIVTITSYKSGNFQIKEDDINYFIKKTRFYDIYEIVTYLYSKNNILYYNNRVYFDDFPNKLTYLFPKLYFTWFVNHKNIDVCNKYYIILYKEYILKKNMDICIKEMMLNIVHKNTVKNFYKNDMLWRIQHIMCLNIDIAKKLGYEFLPKFFIY